MKAVARLALRNLQRHRGRTAMTLVAIAFGVAGLIVTGGFVADIFAQLAEALIHSQSGHAQVFRKGYFEAGTRSPEKYLIEDAPSLRSRLARVPGVLDVMGRLSFSGLASHGNSSTAIVGEGVEPDREQGLGTYLQYVAGRPLRDADEDGVVLGQGAAASLGVRPGDRVTIVVSTAGGALNTLDFSVVGVFQSFSRDYDARAVRIPLAAAQELLRTEGVNALVVTLHATDQTGAAVPSIAKLLGSSDLEVRDWIALNDFYGKTVALYSRQFGVLEAIILAMVLLSVANAVNMSAFERLSEFGTLMALGDTRRRVFGVIVVESILLGGCGAMLGTVVGIAAALVISAIGIPMPPPPNANLAYFAGVRVVPQVVAIACSIGIAATIIAALFPAWRIARFPVAEALRTSM